MVMVISFLIGGIGALIAVVNYNSYMAFGICLLFWGIKIFVSYKNK